MTNTLSIFNPTFKDFDKFFVGFDDHVNRLQKIGSEVAKNVPNYPPYNIRKNSESSYTVELACAGFGKSDIDIEMEGDKLVIRGNITEESDDDYLFKGIANRAFTRTFTLMDNIEVKNAELVNGMLKIFLEGQHEIAKKIKIDVK